LTVEDAEEKDSISTVTGSDYTPVSGRTFLQIDVSIRALDPASLEDISVNEFAVIDSSGEIHTVDAAGFGGLILCVGCNFSFWFSVSGGPSAFTLVYVVPEDEIDEPFELQYGRASAFPFEVGARPDIPYTTEIGPEEGGMPSTCDFEEPGPLGEEGMLTIKQWEGDSLTLSAVKPDGSMVGDCTGLAYGDLAFADDGAILMRLGPLQGWPGLSLIEPDGGVTDLVRNAVDTFGLFSPSGRYVFFTVTTLDNDDEESLYVFDREEDSTEELKEGDFINFKLLASGQLLVEVRESGDSDIYMAEADSTDLERLSLPDDAGYSSVQEDGEHIVYGVESGATWTLLLAELDGDEEQELASYSSSQSEPSGSLSLDGQYALLLLRDDDDDRYVEFLDLTTDDGETIVSDISRLRSGFSSDGSWAFAIGLERLSDSEWESTLFVIDTDSGDVVKEIDDAIDAAFSPDGSQLAYTLGTEDDAEVFIIDLGEGTETSLGEGSLGGWSP
jgi:Tol biopolymer transport system component